MGVILYLFVGLVVIGALGWAVVTFAPMPSPQARTVVTGVTVLLMIFWAIYCLFPGLLAGGPVAIPR